MRVACSQARRPQATHSPLSLGPAARQGSLRKIHLGIDEETLEIRAVEITGSHIGDAPVLPDLLNQIPADEAIGSITIDGAFDTRKCHNAIPDRGANAVIPRVKTPSRGRLFLLVPDPEARPGEFRNTSAARSGEIGRDITGEAASRPRCTALNCLINASWHGTSTNRGCDKNPIQLFMLFQARTSKVPIELLSDLLFLSPSRTSTYSDATV